MLKSSILSFSVKCGSVLENIVGSNFIAKRSIAVNNNAVIVGTTIATSRLGSTKKLVVVETKDTVRGVSQTHVARLVTKTQFPKGTRVYVSGILRSRKIPSENQKSRDMTVINADTWSVLDRIDNNPKDENIIRLNGRIASELVHKENHSVFAIAYDLPAKNIEDRKSEFHTVFLFESQAQDSIRKSLKKGDFIHLTGQMQSNSFIDAKGKKKRSGMVVADSIYKRASQWNAVEDDEVVEKRESNENDASSDDEEYVERIHHRDSTNSFEKFKNDGGKH